MSMYPKCGSAKMVSTEMCVNDCTAKSEQRKCSQWGRDQSGDPVCCSKSGICDKFSTYKNTCGKDANLPVGKTHNQPCNSGDAALNFKYCVIQADTAKELKGKLDELADGHKDACARYKGKDGKPRTLVLPAYKPDEYFTEDGRFNFKVLCQGTHDGTTRYGAKAHQEYMDLMDAQNSFVSFPQYVPYSYTQPQDLTSVYAIIAVAMFLLVCGSICVITNGVIAAGCYYLGAKGSGASEPSKPGRNGLAQHYDHDRV
mmetsp:Transcript_8820/g.13625  ORF Transcript_8820/g.13625 Transcript_8820/m.13625 type:complete len:257 (+) Transcript_8820:59-829(+)